MFTKQEIYEFDRWFDIILRAADYIPRSESGLSIARCAINGGVWKIKYPNGAKRQGAGAAIALD